MHFLKSRQLLVLLFALVTRPLWAQGTIYVDPVSGSNGATGSSSDPFKTLTEALAVATPGMDVILRSGTYSPATNGETFPITVRDRVDIRPDSGHAPVFDGDGAAVVFQMNGDITALTVVKLFQVTDCAVGFQVNEGFRANGLFVDDTLFDSFTSVGFRAVLSTANNILGVRNSDFSGNGASHGVRILVQNNSSASLLAGGVEECTVQGCATGIAVEASGGGDVGGSFFVERNVVLGHSAAGIFVGAEAGSGAATVNSCTVQGNRVQGDGSALTDEVGLWLEASFLGGSVQAARVDGEVLYNVALANHRNVLSTTANQVGGGAVDVVSAFIGNSFTGATGDNIVFDAQNPAAGGDNNAPDFGDTSLFPGGGGRNTIQGSAGFEMVLDGDMQNVVKAENNFWDQASTVDILNRIQTNDALPPDVDPFLLTNMTATVYPRTIEENTAANVTVRAGAQSAFVDNPNDDPQSAGQILVTVGVNLVDAVVFADGSGLSFVSPLLDKGTFLVTVVNPGGQTANAVLRVTEARGGGGGGGGICAVATAAHGDPDAPEVRVLRALRDEYLLEHAPGRAFVAAYYRHAPPLARWIEEREWARAATRALLAPPVAVSRLLLAWDRSTRLLAGAALLGLAFWLLRRR